MNELSNRNMELEARIKAMQGDKKVCSHRCQEYTLTRINNALLTTMHHHMRKQGSLFNANKSDVLKMNP